MESLNMSALMMTIMIQHKMKTQIRAGVFETNSSSTHSVTIQFDDYFESEFDGGEDGDYVCLDERDLNYILSNLPTELLENELKKRNSNENTN